MMQKETKLGGDAFEDRETAGNDVIRVDVEMENFTLVASTEIEATSETDGTNKSIDVFASTAFANLEIGAAYQNLQMAGETDETSTWGVSLSYDAGFAKFAADYSDTDNTAKFYNIAVSVPVAKTTKVAVGMLNKEPEIGSDATEWYANVTYTFANQKNVSIFAEINDTDETNVDMGYLAGLRVKF